MSQKRGEQMPQNMGSKCPEIETIHVLGATQRRKTTSDITCSSMCLNIFEESQFGNSCVMTNIFGFDWDVVKKLSVHKKIDSLAKTCKDFEAATASEVCRDQFLSSQGEQEKKKETCYGGRITELKESFSLSPLKYLQV